MLFALGSEGPKRSWKYVSGRRRGQCKGPKMGRSRVGSRMGQKAVVAGAQGLAGRVAGDGALHAMFSTLLEILIFGLRTPGVIKRF